MGEAREVMDRMTETMMSQDFEALGELYASDAVAVTPDQGEVRGREQIVQYLKQFIDAFPDLQYESLHAHESGNTAIDEGLVVGTNTQPLPMPNGDSLPPTGKQIRVRSVDVSDGRQRCDHRPPLLSTRWSSSANWVCCQKCRRAPEPHG